MRCWCSVRLTLLLLVIVFYPLLVHSQKRGNYEPATAAIYNRFNNYSFPLMNLETADSMPFNTALLANKTVYVDFWFTQCAPCIQEIPFSKALHQYFGADTNIVFLNICVDMTGQKEVWRKLVHQSAPNVINVFYAKNQPQKINLMRLLGVNDYPTYLILN